MNMECSEFKRNNALLISLAISVITAIFLLILMISLGMFIDSDSMITGITLPAVLSLFLIPKIIQKLLNVKLEKCFFRTKKDMITIAIMSLFIVAYVILFRKYFDSLYMLGTIIFHYLIVSLGEEFIYRGLLLKILSERYKPLIAIAISAFMFSFILHINENILVNLCLRFPMGLVFGYIAYKKKCISYTIMIHTMYNLIVLLV